jgi:sterol O-acyltransferase
MPIKDSKSAERSVLESKKTPAPFASAPHRSSSEVRLHNRDLRIPFHEKIFIPRESLLTEMMSEKLDNSNDTISDRQSESSDELAESTRAMFNAVSASFIWLFVRLLLEENKNTGGAISVGKAFFNLILALHETSLSIFGGLFVSLLHVAVLNICSLSIIPLVQLMKSKEFRPRLLLFMYVLIILSILTYASAICLYYAKLAPASGLIVMCEAVRLSMKVHAYCREKLVHGLTSFYRLRHGAPSIQERALIREGLWKQLRQLSSSVSSPSSSATAAIVPEASSSSSSTSSTTTTSSPTTTAPLVPSRISGGPPIPSFILSLESFRDHAPTSRRQHCLVNHQESEHRTQESEHRTQTLLRESQPKISIGSMSQETNRFIFFLFAPTLIYRDTYPLLKQKLSARIYSSLSHIVSFVFTIIMGLLVMHGMITPALIPVLSSVKSLVTPASFFLVVYELIMPSMILFILTHFAVLHAWQNIFASLLGFADKTFYGSWWTSKSWGSWYRRWNLCVGEFLWTYVYSDVQRGGHSLNHALFCVFIYSAILHELILICAFKFFNPALFLFFTGPGVALLSLTRKLGPRFANTFMWLALSLGVSLLFVVYAIEGSLRQAELRHTSNSADIGQIAESIHSMAYDLVIPRSVIALINVLKTGEFTTTMTTMTAPTTTTSSLPTLCEIAY